MRPLRRYLFTTLSCLGVMVAAWAILGQSKPASRAAWSFQNNTQTAWFYESGLQAAIEEALAGETGHYGVAVKHLLTGEGALYDPDHQFASASLYKLVVLYAAYWQRQKGDLSFDEILVMTPEAAVLTDEEGPSIPIGGAISVEDAIYQMITVSDNSSGILLLQRIGPATVNGLASDMGLRQTEIGVGEVALTSPADILLLLEKIFEDEEQTLEARQEMIGILLEQTINDRLPQYLPEGTPIAHKTGNWADSVHDAGIVFAPTGPYAIVVMSEELPYPEEGAEVIARLSRFVYDYFDR